MGWVALTDGEVMAILAAPEATTSKAIAEALGIETSQVTYIRSGESRRALRLKHRLGLPTSPVRVYYTENGSTVALPITAGRSRAAPR